MASVRNLRTHLLFSFSHLLTNVKQRKEIKLNVKWKELKLNDKSYFLRHIFTPKSEFSLMVVMSNPSHAVRLKERGLTLLYLLLE